MLRFGSLPRRLILLLCGLSGLLAGPLALAQSGGPVTTTAPQLRELEVDALDGGFLVTVDGAADAGTLAPPTLLEDSRAEYPAALAGSQTSGQVELELLIDAAGSVAETRVSRSSQPDFEAAALAASHGLRFAPATLDGVPLATRIHFLYRFKPAPAPGSHATLKGLVRSKGNRRPIVGATLRVAGHDGAIETDASARFEVELPSGAVKLQLSAPGFKPAELSETLAPEQSLEVVYSLEPTRVNPYETFVRGEKERTEVARITLHAQELTEVAGTMGDPFRVVMLMPGVSSVMSGVSYPVVRGSQPAATGYFVDGIRVPELFHLLLGPAVLYPELIETVDFYPGPAPARYGRLMGGAVDGTLRRPREDRVHLSAYVDLINAGAMLEDWNPQSGTSVTVAGRVSYTAWLTKLVAKAVVPPDPAGFRTLPVANFWDYQARLEQRVGPGKLRLFAFGSSDEAGARSDNPEAVNPTIVSAFHRFDLRYRQPLGPGEAEVGLTYGVQNLGLRGEEGGQPWGSFELAEQETVARASWAGALGPQVQLSLGGDVTARRSHTVIEMGDAASQGGSTGPQTFAEPLVLTTFSGLWGQLVWKPTEALMVVPGLRLDDFHLTPGLDFLAAEPRLTLRYQLSPKLVLKSGAGLVHQPPTVLLNLPVMDAASLRMGLQSGAQFDVGAEWTPLAGFEVAVDAYYNPIFRAVELNILDVLQSRRRFSIPGYDPGVPGRGYGAEILVRHPIGDHWFAWVSYAYQRSERLESFSRLDDHNQLLGIARAWVPFAFEQRHVANAALSYQFDSGWTVGAALHFNTGRPQSGEVTLPSFHEGQGLDGQPLWVYDDRDRVQRLPPFFRVDARIAKTWLFEQHSLEWYLDIQNVSVSQEVLAYRYDYVGNVVPRFDPNTTRTLYKTPFQFPVVVPMMGLKFSY